MSHHQMFHKIAVAVSFSSSCEAIVSESVKIQAAFNAHINFIHVGSVSENNKAYLHGLVSKYHANPSKVEFTWLNGDPVEAILHQTKNDDTDLIIAGALEKQSIVKYIFGGVARQLSRKTSCSMLVLCEPNVFGSSYNHIVCEASDHPKTLNSIKAATVFATAFKASQIDLIQETNLSKQVLIRSNELLPEEANAIKEEIESEEYKKIQDWLNKINCKHLKITTERIEGKPGFVITEFARNNRANLLVINGPDRPFNLLDRVFPHDIEFALADLPCNLLLVQPKQPILI